MARFDEVFDVKENASRTLITDDALVNTILLKDVNSTVEDRASLLYKNIFPYKKAIQETITDKTCFITMEYAAFGTVEYKFKEASLTFYVIVHEDLMRMKLGNRYVVRTDYLAHRIDDLFNQTRGFGIGRLSFGGMKTVEMPNGWEGLAIYYNTMDFN